MSFSYFLYVGTNRSRTFGSVEIRWLFNDSSTPFGYVDRVIVVSCSLIGVFDRMSPAMIERRMTLRCSRRESPKYFLELTREKLCPRTRELRSEYRRLRILFVAQHNRYLTKLQSCFDMINQCGGCICPKKKLCENFEKERFRLNYSRVSNDLFYFLIRK